MGELAAERLHAEAARVPSAAESSEPRLAPDGRRAPPASAPAARTSAGASPASTPLVPAARPHFHRRTNALLASLTAFRDGLQALEVARTANNRALNRDPADAEPLAWRRSAPHGHFSPFAH